MWSCFQLVIAKIKQNEKTKTITTINPYKIILNIYKYILYEKKFELIALFTKKKSLLKFLLRKFLNCYEKNRSKIRVPGVRILLYYLKLKTGTDLALTTKKKLASCQFFCASKKCPNLSGFQGVCYLGLL